MYLISIKDSNKLCARYNCALGIHLCADIVEIAGFAIHLSRSTLAAGNIHHICSQTVHPLALLWVFVYLEFGEALDVFLVTATISFFTLVWKRTCTFALSIGHATLLT